MFCDAIERPLIIFGGIATKYFREIYPELHKKGSIKSSVKIFVEFENASNDLVESKLVEYDKFKFARPKFPENFTNAQKMIYMYYHLGFKKIQSDLVAALKEECKTDEEKKEAGRKGNIYPDEVLNSLALLQTYATEPDPDLRISDKDVEEVLLHLEMTYDQWSDGKKQFRINGLGIAPWSLADDILPQNAIQNRMQISKNVLHIETTRIKR